jgi:superfamily II RNA helicase
MALAGVGHHHAGMLPIHKEIVERLFTSGLLRMLFATETFALGVNMPARAVAFDSLRKFDGERMDYMLCREYGQMAGRAGRQGIDSHGLVVCRIDPAHDKSRGVRRVLTGGNEAVESRFDPTYSTVLSLYAHMGDRVVETYERSFAKFQRDLRRGRQGGRSSEEKTLAARLALLKEYGYVEGGRVTEKGRFAAHVSGHEIQAAEWREAGLFTRLDARHLGALCLAASYEPRIEEMTNPPRDRETAALRDEALEIVARWRSAEWEAGLTDLVKEPHFGMSAVLEAWLDGAPLARCKELTSASEGDVVRWLRQMLQYARQIERALGQHEHDVRRKLRDLRRAADRDEVDARRQLELGQDVVAAEEADEEGAAEDDVVPAEEADAPPARDRAPQPPEAPAAPPAMPAMPAEPEDEVPGDEEFGAGIP